MISHRTLGSRAALATAAIGFGLCACSGSSVSPNPPVQVNPLSGDLQLAVGSANIFGDVNGSTNIGLNVVETFRQVANGTLPGASAAFVTTPALSGPFTLGSATCAAADGAGATVQTGPGPSDAGTHTMNGSPQPNPGDPTVPASTFGADTNASGFGLEPFNFTSINGNNAGTPFTYTPFLVPLFDALDNTANAACSPSQAADPNSFEPWGGPPAYDPNHDGTGVRSQLNPTGVVGVSLGLDVFENVAPTPGTYTLSAVVPTSPTTSGTKVATATLGAVILPAIVPATVVPDASGDGGASVTATLPAGVSEALVQVEDVGPDVVPTGAVLCDPNTPVFYTLLFRTSGTQPLAANAGPNKLPSICSSVQNSNANAAANGGTGAPLNGDAFYVQTIGFDYPAYEASYPQSSGNPLPPLPGAGGHADITISSAELCLQPAGAPVACGPSTAAAPASAVRKALLLRKLGRLQKLHPVVRGAVSVKRT